MELGLQEKVIIVTGGGSGIGASVVDKLSLIGATPVIVDKSKPDNTFYEHIKKRCPRAVWKTLDLCDDQDCEDTVRDILVELGKIDGLVNNAYPRTTDWGDKFEDVSPESFSKNIDMQLSRIFAISKPILEIPNSILTPKIKTSIKLYNNSSISPIAPFVGSCAGVISVWGYKCSG